MKESNYSMQEQFKKLLEKDQHLPVPEVNVRARVRSTLEQELSSTIRVEDLCEIVVRWFSGFKGRLFAGVFVLTVLLAGFFVISESATIFSSDVESDGVSDFMDSGDWSQLL